MRPEYYVFTFGEGQQHEGQYVKIYSYSYGEARDIMISRYGLDWGFQYSRREWEKWINEKPDYIPLEECLEVIRPQK